MDEKVKMIHELMERINSKISLLKKNKESLKDFNFKIEAFLQILNSFSIQKNPTQIINDSSNKTEEVSKKNSSLGREKEFSAIVSNKSNQIKEELIRFEDKNIEIPPQNVFSIENILEKIKNIKKDRLFSVNSEKILNILDKNENGVTLEMLMKQSGVSKYRCIDIINELMKIKPQVISKKWDKVFYFSLNRF